VEGFLNIFRGKRPLAGRGQPYRLIGSTDDNLAVQVHVGGYWSVPELVRQLSSATGRLHEGTEWCTCGHLGNGFVLTAGHCMPPNLRNLAEKDGPKPLPELWFIEWRAVHVEQAGGGLKVEPTSVSTGLELITSAFDESATPAVDYAVLRVKNAPEARYRLAAAAPQLPSRITALHSRNPNLEYATGSVEALVQGRPFMQHTCDLQAHSSGALVLDRELRVFAIHSGDVSGDVTHNEAMLIAGLGLEKYGGA
jgi:hypothetical protein